MKKKIIGLLIICVALCASVFAAGDISVYIDGNPLKFARAPYTENDRTMVPMRAIFEYLGCTVDWEDGVQSITAKKDSTTIIMSINSPVMYVNGDAVRLDAAPALMTDTTFVPLRAVSESLGCDVTWSEETRSVFIVTPIIVKLPTYAGGVPDFGEIVGITPHPILENGTIYNYLGVTPEMEAEYMKVMLEQGFEATQTGPYTIYYRGETSVLAGFSGEVFRVVITNY